MKLVSHPDSGFDGNYIHFELTINGINVACAVTADCLALIAQRNRLSLDSYQATFGLFRDEIEAIAARKYIEGDKGLLIKAADLVQLSRLKWNW